MAWYNVNPSHLLPQASWSTLWDQDLSNTVGELEAYFYSIPKLELSTPETVADGEQLFGFREATEVLRHTKQLIHLLSLFAYPHLKISSSLFSYPLLKIIWKNQNPEDCSTANYLIIRCHNHGMEERRDCPLSAMSWTHVWCAVDPDSYCLAKRQDLAPKSMSKHHGCLWPLRWIAS